MAYQRGLFFVLVTTRDIGQQSEVIVVKYVCVLQEWGLTAHYRSNMSGGGGGGYIARLDVSYIWRGD